MIPVLESAPESDFGSFGPLIMTILAPVLESAPLVVLNIAGAYYNQQNYL